MEFGETRAINNSQDSLNFDPLTPHKTDKYADDSLDSEPANFESVAEKREGFHVTAKFKTLRASQNVQVNPRASKPKSEKVKIPDVSRG